MGFFFADFDINTIQVTYPIYIFKSAWRKNKNIVVNLASFSLKAGTEGSNHTKWVSHFQYKREITKVSFEYHASI